MAYFGDSFLKQPIAKFFWHHSASFSLEEKKVPILSGKFYNLFYADYFVSKWDDDTTAGFTINFIVEHLKF